MSNTCNINEFIITMWQFVLVVTYFLINKLLNVGPD